MYKVGTLLYMKDALRQQYPEWYAPGVRVAVVATPAQQECTLQEDILAQRLWFSDTMKTEVWELSDLKRYWTDKEIE